MTPSTDAERRGSEPACPVTGAPGAPEDYPGLTKRDAFAMAAMQGVLANPGDERNGNSINNGTPDGVADFAIAHADALLNRLSLNQEPRT